jgi:hypothetical protein
MASVNSTYEGALNYVLAIIDFRKQIHVNETRFWVIGDSLESAKDNETSTYIFKKDVSQLTKELTERGYTVASTNRTLTVSWVATVTASTTPVPTTAIIVESTMSEYMTGHEEKQVLKFVCPSSIADTVADLMEQISASNRADIAEFSNTTIAGNHEIIKRLADLAGWVTVYSEPHHGYYDPRPTYIFGPTETSLLQPIVNDNQFKQVTGVRYVEVGVE